MLQLISHVVRISARRDRTEINSAFIEALCELFHPITATIHRCYVGQQKTVIFACAGSGPEGLYAHNAYLPDHRYCHLIETDPLLEQCSNTQAMVLKKHADGSQRAVFPITRPDRLLYLIDLTLPKTLTPNQRVTLLGLVEYFSNHIALLDYGESDTLTGLASRKTFDKHLFELLGQASADEQDDGNPSQHRRSGKNDSSHWLAVCDIDHFKRINDNFGHLIGDEVLIMVAQAMRHALRFDDQLFRFGGEEFIALLQPTDQKSAHEVLERFRREIEQHVFSRVGHVTISIGFSCLLPNDTPTDVIDRADEALYYAKRNGRNQVACYEDLVAEGKVNAKEITKGEIELF